MKLWSYRSLLVEISWQFSWWWCSKLSGCQ